MAKMTGSEELHRIPPKVLQLYSAVIQLFEEGMEPTQLRVSAITDKAGIGKGTAYEYFDSKEEIIVGALVYQMQMTVMGLEKGLLEQKSFQEQLNFLLEEIDKQDGQKNCFLRLVHHLTDNSEFSREFRSRLDSAEFNQYRLVPMFRKVLQAAVERGELRRDLPLDYMVYSMGGRVLAYMVAVTEGGLQIELSQMRELVYKGILAELCENRMCENS